MAFEFSPEHMQRILGALEECTGLVQRIDGTYAAVGVAGRNALPFYQTLSMILGEALDESSDYDILTFI